MEYMIPHDRVSNAQVRFNSRPARRVMNWHGLPIKIEIEVGDDKSGYDERGNQWSHTYTVPYGEIPKSRALSDGDPVDVYVGPADKAALVYVVHQLKRDGSYDEDKCMLNFLSQGDAVLAYKQHGPVWGFGGMDTMTVDQFLNGYLASNRSL